LSTGIDPRRLGALRERPSVVRRRYAVMLMAALLVAGCASGSRRPKVATASRSGQPRSATGAPSASGDVVAEYIDAQRRWVACLRKRGLDASDPDATGVVTMPYDNTRKADPEILAKLMPCRSLQVTVPQEVGDLRLPPLTDAQREVKRRYSECMQDNGAPDFPDPRDNGYFADTPWNQVGPGVARATRACAPIIGAPTDPGPGLG
jgi:hypothetical protein